MLTDVDKTDVSLAQTDTSLDVDKTNVSLARTDTSLAETDALLDQSDTSLVKTDTSLAQTNTALAKTDTSLAKTSPKDPVLPDLELAQTDDEDSYLAKDDRNKLEQVESGIFEVVPESADEDDEADFVLNLSSSPARSQTSSLAVETSEFDTVEDIEPKPGLSIETSTDSLNYNSGNTFPIAKGSVIRPPTLNI